MEISQETIKALLKKYSGQQVILNIPLYTEDVEPAEPVEPGEPSAEVFPLIEGNEMQGADFRRGASSNDDHKGEWYVILNEKFRNKVKKVVVAGEAYEFSSNYKGLRPLFYGKPSTGIVTVYMENGATYRSGEQQVSTGKPYHHINFRSWKGKGTSIVFCPGAKVKAVSIGGHDLREHGSLDNGRVVFTDYNTTDLDGLVEIEFADGTQWRGEVISNGDMIYGDCA